MAKRKKRNGIEYRAERDRWGYRVCLQGRTYKRYVWATREEAKAALIELKTEVASRPKTPELPPTALITVVSAYLVESAEKGRSGWRIDGMRWNFDKIIIPFFGAATPIGSITSDQVQKLVIQRERNVKPKTVWHDVTNLRALLNWAIEKNLLVKNPVDALDTSIIGSTKPKKAPLNLPAVERAAESIENPADRAYFDFLRFSGLRKDEANRLRWEDINFDEGYFHCRGTKTDESDAYLPLAPALIESLKKHKAGSMSDYVFAGRSAQTKGKKSIRAGACSRRSSGLLLAARTVRAATSASVATAGTANESKPSRASIAARNVGRSTSTKALVALPVDRAIFSRA